MKADSTKVQKRKRVQISFKDSPSLTKQSFKDECNINNIISKYENHGILPGNIHQNATYSYAPNLELKEALDLVKNHQENFEDLPENIQEIFGQNSNNYFEFLDKFESAPESFYEAFKSKSDTMVSESAKEAEKAASGSPDEVGGSET